MGKDKKNEKTGKSNDRYLLSMKMDDLSNDMRDESFLSIHSVYTQAAGLLFLFMSLYIILAQNHVIGQESWFRQTLLPFLSNPLWEDLWEYLIENIIFAFVFGALLYWIRRGAEKNWIEKNRAVWLKGNWLHIHEKNNNTIRVGYVQITQNHDSINAVSRNYNVADIMNVHSITDWHYVNAQVNRDKDEDFILQGFYSARKDSGEKNNGMHSLSIKPRSGDIPIQMAGNFGDVNTLAHDSAESAKDSYLSCGRLRMFRMTKEQEEYLFEDGEFIPEHFNKMLQGEGPKFVHHHSEDYGKSVRTSMEERGITFLKPLGEKVEG